MSWINVSLQNHRSRPVIWSVTFLFEPDCNRARQDQRCRLCNFRYHIQDSFCFRRCKSLGNVIEHFILSFMLGVEHNSRLLMLSFTRYVRLVVKMTQALYLGLLDLWLSLAFKMAGLCECLRPRRSTALCRRKDVFRFRLWNCWRFYLRVLLV